MVGDNGFCFAAFPGSQLDSLSGDKLWITKTLLLRAPAPIEVRDASAAKGSSHALRFIAHISLVWMVLQRVCVGRLACSAEMAMESAFGGLAIAAICGM